MYRLLEEIPASPKNSRTRQEQPPKKRSLKKGKPAGRACSRRGGYNHRPQPIGRPVTSAGRRNATPIGVAFRTFGPILGLGRETAREVAGNGTCQPGPMYVVSDLPIKRLTRATRKGLSALAAEQGSFAAPFNPLSGTRGGNSHRKGITEESTCRAESLQRPGATPVEFLCGVRESNSGAIPSGIVADCAELNSGAVCRMSSSDQIAGRGVPVRVRTGGRQRKFSSGMHSG